MIEVTSPRNRHPIKKIKARGLGEGVPGDEGEGMKPRERRARDGAPGGAAKPVTRSAKPQTGAAKPAAQSAKARAPEMYFADRGALRAWLTRNHATHPPIWLVYDKATPGGGARALSYDAIVEEALCFGWIDSVSGRVDERRSKLYFSARKPGSVWSALNKRRIQTLTEQGLMTPAGQALITRAQADGSWTALDRAEALEIPKDLLAAFTAASRIASPTGRSRARRARANFESFPPGVRKRILWWVMSAKRPQTRAARVAEVARDAARSVRTGEAIGRSRKA